MSLTSIRKILRELAFNPKKDEFWKTFLKLPIDRHYLTIKAIEEINAARTSQRKEPLILAIRLLILAILLEK